MTLNSILVVSVIFLLFLLLIVFIVKAKSKKKPSYAPDKDLWDHLSSEQPESIDFGTHRIRIHRNEGWELEPKIGNFAKPWLKPNTNTVIFYERGYIGGGGQVGWLMHRGLAKHLRKEGLADAVILEYDSESCLIDLTVYDKFGPE